MVCHLKMELQVEHMELKNLAKQLYDSSRKWRIMAIIMDLAI